MCEKEFLKFYKKEKKLKNIETAKEKLELFWKVVFAGLAQDKKVIVKDFGVFELKKLKPRKIYDIHKNILFMTKYRVWQNFWGRTVPRPWNTEAGSSGPSQNSVTKPLRYSKRLMEQSLPS